METSFICLQKAAFFKQIVFLFSVTCFLMNGLGFFVPR